MVKEMQSTATIKKTSKPIIIASILGPKLHLLEKLSQNHPPGQHTCPAQSNMYWKKLQNIFHTNYLLKISNLQGFTKPWSFLPRYRDESASFAF